VYSCKRYVFVGLRLSEKIEKCKSPKKRGTTIKTVIILKNMKEEEHTASNKIVNI